MREEGKHSSSAVRAVLSFCGKRTSTSSPWRSGGGGLVGGCCCCWLLCVSCGRVLDREHRAGVSRDQVGEREVRLPDDGRTALVLGVAVEDALDVLEGCTGEGAHVEPKSEEVGVKEWSHERVSEEKRTKEDAGKDGNLGIGDKAHGRVVVGLDPALDELGDLGWRCGGLGGRCAAGCGLVGTGGGRSRGEDDGNDGGAEEGENVEEREGDKGDEGDEDRFGHEPVDGEEEVLDVFIHEGALDIRLIQLRNAKRLVDDDAVRDDGAEVGGGVPS